jgi:hypothetical protein
MRILNSGSIFVRALKQACTIRAGISNETASPLHQFHTKHDPRGYPAGPDEDRRHRWSIGTSHRGPATQIANGSSRRQALRRVGFYDSGSCCDGWIGVETMQFQDGSG